MVILEIFRLKFGETFCLNLVIRWRSRFWYYNMIKLIDSHVWDFLIYTRRLLDHSDHCPHHGQQQHLGLFQVQQRGQGSTLQHDDECNVKRSYKLHDKCIQRKRSSSSYRVSQSLNCHKSYANNRIDMFLAWDWMAYSDIFRWPRGTGFLSRPLNCMQIWFHFPSKFHITRCL